MKILERKELSIEDKAKAYDEAIERANELNYVSDKDSLQRKTIEHIFPELKESDDERIIKMIIQHMERWHECALENNVIQDIKDSTDAITWLEKQGAPNKWKPSKDEMDALYGLAYITNKMDDKKDEAITKLYQDLKKEFFNEASYENMFPSSPVDSDINIEKQGEQKPQYKLALEVAKEEKVDNQNCAKPADKVERKFKTVTAIAIPIELVDNNVETFASIVKEMTELYAKKNHDYGNSFDEGCDKIGTGYPLGRLLDKMNRLIACMGKEDEMQVNESIEDTLKDLACYSVMTLSYLKRKNNK